MFKRLKELFAVESTLAIKIKNLKEVESKVENLEKVVEESVSQARQAVEQEFAQIISSAHEQATVIINQSKTEIDHLETKKVAIAEESSMLKPDKEVQRFLISTTSRMVGEYVSDDLIITHAWQTGGPVEATIQGPFSRNYLMVSASFPDPRKSFQGGVLIYPRLSPERILVYLSVLFGKRFEDNGETLFFGSFRVPNLTPSTPSNFSMIGFNNHKPRANYGIELHLENYKSMEPLFDEGINERVLSIFNAAAKFYLQAIQRFELHPDAAYLDLITCGEILSNFYEYPDDVMYDASLLQKFSAISSLPNGESIMNDIKERLYQVKRRFVYTIVKFLKPDFFENHEAEEHYAALKQENIEKKIKAAYDLRSRYVHTGEDFGQFIAHKSWEISVGEWHADDRSKEFLKIVNQAPTFKGMERIMRYCLLSFLQEHRLINLPEPLIRTEVRNQNIN